MLLEAAMTEAVHSFWLELVRSFLDPTALLENSKAFCVENFLEILVSE